MGTNPENTPKPNFSACRYLILPSISLRKCTVSTHAQHMYTWFTKSATNLEK